VSCGWQSIKKEVGIAAYIEDFCTFPVVFYRGLSASFHRALV